jgi:hypothetical protein
MFLELTADSQRDDIGAPDTTSTQSAQQGVSA